MYVSTTVLLYILYIIVQGNKTIVLTYII